MYTIKQAAQRTGVAIPTIRVWERRYSVVTPTRTPAGYRLYDDAAIERLSAMHHLIEREGWRPSQAAERVRGADPGEIQAIVDDRAVAENDATVVVGLSGSADQAAIDSIVQAATALDLPSIDRTLDETFAGRRFEAAMDAVVFPALRGIGDSWSRGELDVAREHAASETVRRRIAHYFDAAGRTRHGRPVVVGLPPGSRHELGAFAFGVAARRAGLDVLYIGADVPVPAWRDTVRDFDAAAAVLAVMSRSDVRPASEVIRALRGDHVRSIAVGGPSAPDVPADLGAMQLAGSLDTAVTSLLDVIRPDEP